MIKLLFFSFILLIFINISNGNELNKIGKLFKENENGMLVTPLSKIESRSHRTIYEAKVVKGIRGCHEKTFIKLLINSHEDDCPITLNKKHVAFGKYIKIQGEDTYSVHCGFIQLASDLPTYATNYIRETRSCCPTDTGFDSCCSNDITCGGGEMGLFCSNPARPLCGICQSNPENPPCAVDSDCENDLVCRDPDRFSCPCSFNPICREKCTSDSQCETGEYCQFSSGKCFKKICSTFRDCPSLDFSCNSENQCERTSCQSDTDCFGFCLSGKCYSTPSSCTLPPP